MRWLTIVLAFVAGGEVWGLIQQQRFAAQVAGLVAEVRDLQVDAAHPQPVMLAAGEHELLGRLVAARIQQSAAPVRAPASPQTATARGSEAEPREMDPATRAATEQAERVVDSILSIGTLRGDAVMQLRALLAQADPVSAARLRQRISAAINRDELRPADPQAGLP
jgi:hypothetical protein